MLTIKYHKSILATSVMAIALSAAYGFRPSKPMEKTVVPVFSAGGSSTLSSNSSGAVDVYILQPDTVTRYASLTYTGPLSGPSTLTIPANTQIVTLNFSTGSVSSSTNGTITVTGDGGSDSRTYTVVP